MKQKNKLAELFLSFLKIGLFTFGGGYAMIALLEREFVEQKKWLNHEDFLNMVAIAESTPGPVAINSATFIGYRVGKTPGAFLSTLAVCIPSFVIIYMISLFFEAFMSLRLVACAFKGIQVCVSYLILSAGIRMLRKMPKTPFALIVFTLSAGLLLLATLSGRNISAILLILCGAVAGVTVYLVRKLRGEEAGA